MHCLVFTDTDLYSLTKGKSYLAKQKWRRSTCVRDQCYDVGCHPCYLTVSQRMPNGYFKENYNFPRFQRGSNIFQGVQLFPGVGGGPNANF